MRFGGFGRLLCATVIALGWATVVQAQTTEVQPVRATASSDSVARDDTQRADSDQIAGLRRYIARYCDFADNPWCKLEPRNSFEDVEWRKPVPGFDPNARGAKTVFTAFKDMAVGNGKVYFAAGGGSHTYTGNEVYALNLDTLKWERLSDPDPLTAEHEGCPKPEVGPWAMHTYAGTFVKADTLHVWGNFPQCRRGEEIHNSYGAYAAFDLTTGEWGPMHLTGQNGKGHIKIAYAAPYGDKAAAISFRRRSFVWTYDLATGQILDRSPREGKWINAGDGVKIGDRIYYHSGKNGIWTTAPKIGGTGFRALKHVAGPFRAIWGSTGLDYYPPKDRILFWNGKRRVWSTDTSFQDWALYEGRGPNGRKVFGKWEYIAGAEVMLGVTRHNQLWLFRPAEPENRKQNLQAKGYTCSDNLPGWQCPNVQRAVKGGGEVSLPKGVYRQCAVIKTATTLDMNGSRIAGVCHNKGTFVQKADFTLQNATIRGVRPETGNEAGLRREKGRTVLRNVRLIDNHNGVLGSSPGQFKMVGGAVKRNGCCGQVSGKPAGRAHGLYLSKAREVVLRDVVFVEPKGEGHLLKTGARRVVIENSRFDETGGNGSRVIDMFNGGKLTIRDTRIQAALSDGNPDVIGFDYEARQDWSDNRVRIDSGTHIDCAHGRLLAGRNSYARVTTDIDARTERCR